MADRLLKAIQFALDGQWDQSHQIVQEINTNHSNWIHAVLHKIEGDESNSRYWYAQTDHDFLDFDDPNQELKAIQSELT